MSPDRTRTLVLLSLVVVACSAGQALAFSLEWFPSHERPPITRDAYSLLEHTTRRWRAWTCCSTWA